MNRADAGRLGGLAYKNISKELLEQKVKAYNLSPRTCLGCSNPISYNKRNTNTFCSRTCSAKHNNRNKHTSLIPCLTCNEFFKPRPHGKKSKQKFCSQSCSAKYKSISIIEDWKNGKVSGLDATNGTVSKTIRNYLLDKSNHKCSLCQWGKVNPYTNKVPLVIDHIDGNYLNNKESNLRVICWNCDSLGNTFGALNMGNGRKNRRT